MGRVQQDSKNVSSSKSFKTPLSSDRSLQLDFVKLELLVIANQLRRGEYVLGLCTHCLSRPGSWESPKTLNRSRRLNHQLGLSHNKASVAEAVDGSSPF